MKLKNITIRKDSIDEFIKDTGIEVKLPFEATNWKSEFNSEIVTGKVYAYTETKPKRKKK